MGKDHGRKEAEQQAREREIAAQQSVQTAAAPTPLQTELEKGDLDFLSAIKSPTFDIRDPKLGLNPYLSLYDSAVKSRAQDRAGTGALRLGTNTQNPNIAASQDRLNDERRRETAAGGLEQAFRLRNAEVTGSAMPLITTDVNRNLNLAGLQSGRAGDAWANYYRIRAMPTWLEQMRNSAVQGATMAAAGGA
jgi:hypothetical protein